MKRILAAVSLASVLSLVALSDPPENPQPAPEKKIPPIDAAAPAKFETATFALG